MTALIHKITFLFRIWFDKKFNLCKKLESSTRASSHNRLKTIPHSQIKDSSFLYPSICLWNQAPNAVTDATTESQARTAIGKFVKTLPI